MRSVKEVHARVFTKALSGGIKGAAVGAGASLATGAAVVLTAPAWLPVLGGTILVAGSTVVLWSAIGSSLGAVVSGTRAYFKYLNDEKAFHAAFPFSAVKPSPETRQDKQ
jgi:hypothetical protein